MSKALKVTLSNFEKKWICTWGRDSISKGNHWGGGLAFLQEENLLLTKLLSTENDFVLYKNEIRQIYTWLVDRIGDGSVLIGEDMVIGRKIITLYQKAFPEKSKDVESLKKMIGE